MRDQFDKKIISLLIYRGLDLNYISDCSIWSLKLHAIAIPCCIHGLNLLLPLPALMPFDYGNPVAVKDYLGCLHSLIIDLFLKELCLKLSQTMNGGTNCEMAWAFHGHVGVRCWWEACAVCNPTSLNQFIAYDVQHKNDVAGGCNWFCTCSPLVLHWLEETRNNTYANCPRT